MSIIFLLGAVHGLMLTFLLVSKKVNQLSNRILAALMLVFTIDLAMAALLSVDLHQSFPHVIGLDFSITLLYGPLLYLYSETLIKGNERLNLAQKKHFIPFILLTLYFLPFYFNSGETKLNLLNENGELGYGSEWITHFKVVYSLSYLPFIIFDLYAYRKKIRANYSTLEKRNLDWLQGFVLAGALLGITAGVLYTVSSFSDMLSEYTDFTLLASTIFVYSIGYMGLKQAEFFTPIGSEEKRVPEKEKPPQQSYTRSGLNEEQGKELHQQLCALMDKDQPYLRNDLSLAELAGMMNITTHNLTEVINTFADESFYDFVNSYRIEKVKQAIKDPEFQNYTLLGIGLESGFNSKSSFNSVFKKHTGLTPSQYKKSLEN
ncbi:MAG: helix-turn-helix domain-containing protein [Balneola sp.]|jgi:AraC-like DNA-binding protein